MNTDQTVVWGDGQESGLRIVLGAQPTMEHLMVTDNNRATWIYYPVYLIVRPDLLIAL